MGYTYIEDIFKAVDADLILGVNFINDRCNDYFGWIGCKIRCWKTDRETGKWFYRWVLSENFDSTVWN